MNKLTNITLCFLLSIWTIDVAAQCSIKSADVVCEGDLIQFDAQTSGSIQSVSWDFGDGKTGTQQSVSHQYTQTGTMKIKLEIIFVGGSKCTTDKEITVHSKPLPKLSIDPNSKYCLSENDVCLLDSSKMGNTGGKIVTRNVLWGDGDKTTSNNPTFGSKICHTYLVPGNFTITIELVNEHGCKEKQDLMVTVLQDYVTSFTYSSIKKECTYEEICFENDSTKAPSELKSFYWDFGDGNTSNSNFSKICHQYKAKGTYITKLVITLKNGCQKIIEKTVEVDFPELKFDVTTSAQTICFPGSVKITQNEQYGKLYSWKWVDSAGKSELFSQYNSAQFVPPCPGKFYITLSMGDGNCQRSEIVDTIYAVGVMAKPLARNAVQCNGDDTVYFCHNSKTYRAGPIEYFWDFGDPVAPTCTTDVSKGQNLTSNCNFWLGEEAKHKYPPRTCTEYMLRTRDLKNGCVDSAYGPITMKRPVKEDFEHTTKKACVGLSLEYLVKFTKPECIDSVWINLDSACNKDSFVDFKKNNVYSRVCDSSGWVTVGFITKSGNEKVFRSCDPLDFYYSNKNVCYDTFWFHRWFQLQEPPKAHIQVHTTDCLPVNALVQPLVKKQPNLKLVHLDWNDGTDTTFSFDNQDDTLPNFTHRYTKAGIYNVRFYLETDSGCVDAMARKVTVGYFNEIRGDSVMCPGDTIVLFDSLHYWGDNKMYWRIQNRPEKFWFNVLDGQGFKHNTTPTLFTAKHPGNYTVRMASVDSKGCTDTAEKVIHVVEVKAGIKEVTKRIICDDILQLFDSTTSSWKGDTAYKHFWEFGDFTTPSYLENPFHFYRNYGEFTVTHIVETELGCKDTAVYQLEIDGPVSHFDIISDTVGCEPYTAKFFNNSKRANDFIWDFGDSSTYHTKSDTSVEHTYKKAGIYYITLTASDSIVNPDNNNQIYFCSGIFPDTSNHRIVRRIVVLPIPKVDFELVRPACKGKMIELKNLSDTIYKEFRWIYGSTDTTTLNHTVEILAEDTGEQTVRLLPTYNPRGPYQRQCYDSVDKKIRVHYVEAEFDFVQDPICPKFTFTSKAKNAKEVLWDFGHLGSDNNNSNDHIAVHNYAPDTGTFTVCLYVSEENGCLDTACTDVRSSLQQHLFVPNVFTPNNDTYNDEYEIDIENESFYHLTIYNRWGEKVYEADQDYSLGQNLNWDGTDQKGRALPEGTYFYVLDYRFECREELERKQGAITLIRD